jgi:hypothetical protein
MGPKGKKAKAGAENRSRAPAEFKAGQRVLNAGKIAHVTGVVYDRIKKAHVYTIRVENDAVQVAPSVLQRVAGTSDLFSEGQLRTPVRPLLEIDVGGKSLSDATHHAVAWS